MILTLLFQRVCWTLGVLIAVSILAFGLQELSPGDPARLLLQASGLEIITQADIDQVRAQLALDRSVVERYLNWLGRMVRGDFGQSYIKQEDVSVLLAQRLPNTALLALTATLLSLLIAVPLGLLSAFRKDSWIDRAVQVYVALGGAIPGFYLSLLLILLFASTLRLLPAFGAPTFSGMILPTVSLALPNAVILTRLVRAATLDTLSQPWMLTARAKGIGKMRIILWHLLPAVMTPVLAVTGLELANLLTGAAVVEYVFAWPGIGKLAVDSVLGRDMPVVVAFALLAGITFVLINATVDIVSAMLDPRMRMQA